MPQKYQNGNYAHGLGFLDIRGHIHFSTVSARTVMLSWQGMVLGWGEAFLPSHPGMSGSAGSPRPTDQIVVRPAEGRHVQLI